MVGLLVAIVLSKAQLSSARPPSTVADPCPFVVRVRPGGQLMTYRFNGWRVTSLQTLESDLKGGCYNDGSPSRVTSVTIEAPKQTPASKLKLLYEVLARNGWPHDRIAIR
jgi:hypothetical protein